MTEKGIPFEVREPTAVYNAGCAVSKKELAKARMQKIQELFADDKGWASEKEMISDLAKFRRLRKKV